MKWSSSNFYSFSVFFLLVGVNAEARLVFEKQIHLESEAAYRSTPQKSDWDTSRLFLGVEGKISSNRNPLSLSASAWAWKNYSASRFQLTDEKIEARSVKLQYWGNNLGIGVGLQEVHWGETFGLEPANLIQARNYRDYSLTDLKRNSIPAWLVNITYDFSYFKVQGIYNPNGEVPILPTQISNLPIPEQKREWGKNPEFGGKLSVPLNQANIDFFGYRHINRWPVFLLSPTGLFPVERTVNSMGGSGSIGLAEVVIRGDSVVTPKHPTLHPGTNTLVERDIFSHVLGFDWTPSQLDSFTIGIQGHWDRYPISQSLDQFAASILVRQGIFNGELTLECQGYQGFQYRDTRISPVVTWNPDFWEFSAYSEIYQLSEGSPAATLGSATRFGVRAGVKF